MSAPQIATAIESLGGTIDSGAHWEASRATIVVMSDKAEPALRILSDVVLHPTFKQEENRRWDPTSNHWDLPIHVVNLDAAE